MNIRRVVKPAAYGVLLLLAALLQLAVLPRLGAVPNAPSSVAAVVSLAVFAGPWGGGAAGLFCGLLCDASLPTVEALFSVSLTAVGVLTGLLCRAALKKSFFTALLLTAAAAAVIEFLLFFIFYFVTGRAEWIAFVQVGLPEALAGVCCVPLLYPCFKGVKRIFAEEG